MIEATALTKRYGGTVAVDDLSFAVRPGHVTGFLGPNGAGKSTTMRMILGLDAPTTCSGHTVPWYRSPPTGTVPEVGRSSPRIIRIVVDLPAPFGPRNPVTCPGLTWKSIPSTATVWP